MPLCAWLDVSLVCESLNSLIIVAFLYKQYNQLQVQTLSKTTTKTLIYLHDLIHYFVLYLLYFVNVV